MNGRMSERTDRLGRLGQTTTDRRRGRVEVERREAVAILEEIEGEHDAAVEALKALKALSVEQPFKPKGRKTAAPAPDALIDARRALAPVGSVTTGNASEDGGWGPLHPGDDPEIWLPRHAARIRKLESQRTAFSVYEASELETLRAHAGQLVEAVAGKIEAAERERDRLAGETQTAKYAISVCEGEVDELADGQAPEAAPDGVQAPAEG